MPKLRIILCACFLVAVQQLIAQSKAEKEEYVIVRQDEKVTMYERWMPFPGTNTNSRQIKCVFQVTTSLENMVTYISEEAKVRTWQKNILEYKIISKYDSTWIVYSHYRIPWPLTNQDYLLTYSVLEKTENRIVISFEHLSDEKLEPVREGVDRKPTTGRWELEKAGVDKIKVTYMITTLPVNYPRFITDRIVHNSLMSTINELIQVAEK